MSAVTISGFLVSFFSAALVFAAGKPVFEDIGLGNAKFAEKIYKALNVEEESIARVGASTLVKNVAGGFECVKSVAVNPTRKKTAKYSCTLIKGRWNLLGEDVYGSGDNKKLSIALYEALDLKAEDMGDGISAKNLEYNIPDGDGGTERNMISCIKTKGAFDTRPTCQIINAM